MEKRTLKIFTAEILASLAANGEATRRAQNAGQTEPDHIPVVKVFNPYGGATWLLTESDPDEPDRLFGLCDLGMGEPELGYVARSEIESVRVNIGGHDLPLERDMYFETDKPLSVFYEAARRAGRIEA
jgi:Protein of unknown function (DUF2958)